MFQAYIPKRRDIRISVVGDAVYGHSLDANRHTGLDWKFDPNHMHVRWDSCTDELSQDLRKRCLALVRTFRLHYATLDLVESTEGTLYFLELNPMGQLVDDSDGHNPNGIVRRLAATLAAGDSVRA